jgi:hypothetical protein
LLALIYKYDKTMITEKDLEKISLGFDTRRVKGADVHIYYGSVSNKWFVQDWSANTQLTHKIKWEKIKGEKHFGFPSLQSALDAYNKTLEKND